MMLHPTPAGGIAYSNLSQYHRAIQDYNEAIRLKPDDVNAYIFRGAAYLASGNDEEACRSLLTACKLGNCEGYELGKKAGTCP